MELTNEQIKKEIEILNDQRNLIDSKLESLQNQLEATCSKNFLEMIKNTNWEMIKNNTSLRYINENRHEDKIEKYVCETLNLWPHGSHFVTENIKVICDDGTVYLKCDINTSDYNYCNENKLDYGKYQLMILISFCIKYNIIVSISDLLVDLEYYTKQLDHKKEYIEKLRLELGNLIK